MTRHAGWHLCFTTKVVILLTFYPSLANAFTTISTRRNSFVHGFGRDHALKKCTSERQRLSSGRYASSDDDGSVEDPARRQAWTILAAAVPSLPLLGTPLPAHAALLQFPCPKLKNRYHFMRAGLSELEAEDLYASNALFLTNRENALVDSPEARKPILEACRIMRDAGQLPTVAYHSLAANGMDTGDLIARTLLLARDRLLPEFTYLDPRGVGLWDGSSYSMTSKAVAAMDFQQAGALGLGGRPPANNDGTPNETLSDQFIRLRQFFSLQESRTSGENILVIFPDGVGPALASAMIAGLPLNTCHALEYQPGEIRLDITQKSVLALYETKKDDPAYLAMLEEGKEYLQTLKKESGLKEFVSLKERRAEEERLQDEKAFVESQKRKQSIDERQRREAMTQLQKEQEEARQERLRLRQEQKQAEEAAKKERMRMQREQQEMARMKAAEERAAKNQDAVVVLGGDDSAVDSTSSSLLDDLPVVLALGATVGGALLAGDNNETTDAVAMAGQKATADQTTPSTTAEEIETPGSTVVAERKPEATTNSKEAISPDNVVATNNKAEPSAATPSSTSSLYAQSVPTVTPPTTNGKASSGNVEEELESLEKAQEAFAAHLASDAARPSRNNSVATNGDTNDDPVQQELDTLERGQSTMNDYLMDFEDDWLRMVAEIRDEDDD